MLNYNLNINSPLQQEKKNEDVRPPISWSFESYASASDSSDLGNLGFASMSITAPNTNCVGVANDNGGLFTTDGQYPVTASLTGSNWPVTGSTTMSLYTAGITYDPVSTNQYYFGAISASALDIYNDANVTGSIITNEFSASEFYRWFTEARITHRKGNIYNPIINWQAKNESPATTTGNINGFTASFNIVKDKDVSLVSIPELTGSNFGTFNNDYAFNITSSLSASVLNDTTGSTTMSIIIPEAGISTSSLLFNSSSAGLQTISASFEATNNNPYNITASVIMNKGNIWNADVKWLVTGSNADSYSMYTIPTQFRLTKDVNVDGAIINQNVEILSYGVTSSISGLWKTEYTFNFKNDITESGTYPIYQVHTYPTTSLLLTPAGTSSVRYDSSSFISYTEFPYTSSYSLTASAWINKIPALDATIAVIGGGSGGGGGTTTGGAGYTVAGGGGGAGGFIQWDVSIIPNVNYDITQIGTAGTGSNSGVTAGQRGTGTSVKFWLGPIKENGTGSIFADGGYGAQPVSDINGNYNQNGGKSGGAWVRYGSDLTPTYIIQKDEIPGGIGNLDNSAAGGAGITGSGQNGDGVPNGGLNLGGGGGAGSQGGAPAGSGSFAPTIFFHSSSFTWTGSAGNGGYVGVNATNASALGGGGGGAYASSSLIGGNGMGGAVIIAYSGSAKLNVPDGTITTFSNGVTWHLIKNTGSFSYVVEPKPNPQEQKYVWRAETLVIAGGGAGGVDEGGGGGAGGYSYNPYVWYEVGKQYSVVVGNGCPSKNANDAPFSGSNSYLVDYKGNTLIFSKGGGNGFAADGGSGGGASNSGNGGNAVPGYINYFTYITSSQTQGFFGGAADPSFAQAGGGGGASQTGSAWNNPYTPRAGGNGKYTLDFIPIGVCGGGNSHGIGNVYNNSIIFGGGLGASTSPGTGSNATSFGSGGGGSRGTGIYTSGAGGNGLVQIRYAGTQRATGGQIETALISGSYYTLHTFTASAVFTPTE